MLTPGENLAYGVNECFCECREHSIVAARASVMVYDESNRRWVPSGTSQGLSKIHIYQHPVNNTFRVVGRKLQDHEVSSVCCASCLCCHLSNQIVNLINKIENCQNMYIFLCFMKFLEMLFIYSNVEF